MDILVPLDRAVGRPLRDQLYDGLRRAILDGRLDPGARLPASRALAAQLGVSRFTVEDAYSRLVAEGYTVGRRGSGTYVAATGITLPPAPRVVEPAAVDPPARRWSVWGARMVRRTGSDTVHDDCQPFPFRSGVPALDAFPVVLWNRLRAEATRGVSFSRWGYGPAAGHPRLRAAIAGYLARSRGITCGADQVVITNGTRQATDLIARLWLERGDTVAIEEPGYPAARRTFEAAGATLMPIPVDADGMRVDLLPRQAPAARLVYVTPSHQYPTGALLSLPRRSALLAWARTVGALVVEDDYDSEFRYGARPVPALAGLDDATLPGSVVYIGTFSKVLYPALRLGYAVLPPDMVGPFVQAKAVADHHSPTGEQLALATFIEEGHFERHLARMRRLYAGRRSALLAALNAYLPGIATRDESVVAAGLHLLVRFEVPLSETAFVTRAAAAGIGLDPAGHCYLSAPPSRPTMLLGYAALPEARIDAGIRALAKAIVGN